MVRPSHRLDLLIVPGNPDTVPSSEVITALSAWLDDVGPGALVDGGGAGWGLDQPGKAVLYANRQGGFHVRCPACAAPLARAFGVAVGRWRAGGAREVACGACGTSHDLDGLDFRPPAAVASFALVIRDAADGRLRDEGRRAVERFLGPVRVVGRRGR